MEEVIKLIISYGVFSVLFCMLLKYVLDENKIRETKYQNTIDKNQKIIEKNQNIISKLADNFTVIEQVKSDVEDIKEEIQRWLK